MQERGGSAPPSRMPGRLRIALVALLGSTAFACAELPPARADAAAAPAAAASAASAPAAGASSAARNAAPVAAAASGAASAPGSPPPPPPFATVIRDATRIDGWLTLWQKDEKVWIELKPGDFNKPMFLSPKLASGIGESRLYSGAMRQAQMVEFRRLHNLVQLRALNPEYIARDNTPERRAVDAGFSPSLLASTPVASAPHSQTKNVLIEANALFVNDMIGIAIDLQRAYRQNYSFDARNSGFLRVRAKPDLVVFETQNHYQAPLISVPMTTTPPPGTPPPTVPRTLVDARSLFVGLHYSLSSLPDTAMRPRRADPRIGTFTTLVQDHSNDYARSPKVRYVNRWRLEKKDPSAPMSEPVKPITFWLDRAIPVEYREAIREGVLEWNKAFERIGIRNAIAVQQQPDDADWDTLDADVASIRWIVSGRASFAAQGPSHVDPRSGEILDADILIDSDAIRFQRALRNLALPSASTVGQSPDPEGLHRCEIGDALSEQMGYALDVLAAHDQPIDPGNPLTRKLVREYLMGVTMHEVGHTLGLRHNFAASRAYTPAQLADPQFTEANGIAASVMEYPAINLPAPGVSLDKAGQLFRGAIGPYDYWAIEYAYKPLSVEAEPAELGRIAARSIEPELAYGTDEDDFLGLDPDALPFDLGNDPVAFTRGRLAIAQDLLRRQERRTADEPDALRRSVRFALFDVARASASLARQIGGVRTARELPGQGRDALRPVPAGAQREALDVLSRGVLSADALAVSPALARRLGGDFLDREDALYRGDLPVQTDFSLDAMVLDVQRGLLARLMSDTLATRILDARAKADRPADAFRLSELYSRLSADVWSEVGKPGDIPPQRRDLQRDHLGRLTDLLLRPAALSRADARALLRADAQALLSRLQAGQKAPGLSEEARAHLADSAEALAQALGARVLRSGV